MRTEVGASYAAPRGGDVRVCLQRVAEPAQQAQHRPRRHLEPALGVSSSASFVDDFDVQRSNDIGFQRVSGCTNPIEGFEQAGLLVDQRLVTRFDSGFWANDTIVALNRLDVRTRWR